MVDLKQLFDELVRFEVEVWNAVDARLRAEHDLPLGRFEPMQVIAGCPKCRVYEIAAALSITTGGTSKLVDALEASGYCRRRPNPDDRRSSIIELTPVGQRLLNRARTTLENELQARIGAVLTDRSAQQFLTALVKLRAAGRQRPAAVSA